VFYGLNSKSSNYEAIKFVNKRSIKTYDDLLDIYSELKIGKLLCETHENIVSLFAGLQSKELFAFIMPLYVCNIDEKDVQVMFLKSDVLFKSLIWKIGSAISHLKSLRIIHRDIKPQNILIDTDMNFKLGDFGSSKHFPASDKDQITKTIIGSPFYIAPEVWFSLEGYSYNADWWSFGVTLYYLKTGKDYLDVIKLDLTEIQDRILKKKLNKDEFSDHSLFQFFSG
ncbi:MAG: NAF domain, partial [Paramarteilia canceri]